MNSEKTIIILAGPNGAGKTTFAKEYLSQEINQRPFINADHIAAMLVPDNPESVAIRAGKMMLETIDALVANSESFVIETTLSGRGYVRKIARWRAAGYRVELEFLSLKTPEHSIRRVATRVRQGGHNIPPDVIRRRFRTGLENFHKIYCNCVDFWRIYDNTHGKSVLLDEGEGNFDRKPDQPDEPMKISERAQPRDPESIPAFRALMRAAKRAHFDAYQHGEGVVVDRNGKPAIIPPDPEMYGELLAEYERKQAEIVKKRAALVAAYEREMAGVEETVS